MSNSNQIMGVFNIMATPFDANYQVDVTSLRSLVDFQIDIGTHGLTILGVMGEAAKLSVEERKLVVDTVIEAADGRVPIVAGTSHDDVQTCITLSKGAVAAGAAGVMIAPPFFDKPTHDADVVRNFYEEIASAYDHPIVVQDFPPANNAFMSPDFLATLAERIPSARYLKLEDPPLMQKISAIMALTDKYRIFGGQGGMFFLEELRRGVVGTMTGFAFTEILVAVCDAMKGSRHEDAIRIFDHYLPLIRFENQPAINLAIRKELLYRRGAITHPSPREPFVPMDERTHQELDWILQRVRIDDPTLRIDIP